MAKTPASADLMALLEIARVALADADTFDEMAARLDLSDGEMLRLRDKVQTMLDTDGGIEAFLKEI